MLSLASPLPSMDMGPSQKPCTSPLSSASTSKCIARSVPSLGSSAISVATKLTCNPSSSTSEQVLMIRKQVKKPYACDICLKTFSRKDVVGRHKTAVHLTERGERKSRRRSCARCAASKLKCSGGIQCGNCRRRGLPCDPGPVTIIEHIKLQQQPSISPNDASQVATPPPYVDKALLSAAHYPTQAIGEYYYASASADGSHEHTHYSRPSKVRSVEVPRKSLPDGIPNSLMQSAYHHPAFITASQHSLPQPNQIALHSQNIYWQGPQTNSTTTISNPQTPGISRLSNEQARQHQLPPTQQTPANYQRNTSFPNNNHDDRLSSLPFSRAPLEKVNLVTFSAKSKQLPATKGSHPPFILTNANEHQLQPEKKYHFRTQNNYSLNPLLRPLEESEKSNKGFVLPPLNKIIAELENKEVDESQQVDSAVLRPMMVLTDTCRHYEDAIPSTHVLEEHINAFFELCWFAPTYNRGSFTPKLAPKVQLAAMAVLGASFTNKPGRRNFADKLAETTVNYINTAIDTAAGVVDQPWFLESIALIGMFCYVSGGSKMNDKAEQLRSTMVSLAKKQGYFELKLSQQDHSDWESYEYKKRIFWLIFEFDCSMCSYSRSRPLMCLADINNTLPCNEDEWNNKAAWKEGANFQDAMDQVLAKGDVVLSLNPYSKTLLAHALGRTISDYYEIESSTQFKAFPVSPKTQLVTGLQVLLSSMKDSGPTSPYSGIVSTIVSYSQMCNCKIMSLVMNISQHPSTERISQLLEAFRSEPEVSRLTAWRASQIIATTSKTKVASTLGEVLYMYSAGLYLFWFCLADTANANATSSIRLGLPWQAEEPEEWIRTGGWAYVLGEDGFVKLSGRDGANSITRLIGLRMESKNAWPLADKWARLINSLAPYIPVEENKKYHTAG